MSSRFEPFIRADVTYRSINGVPLEATILTPKSIAANEPVPADIATTKKYPVIVRWHGGGFIVGHRMYEPWFAQWLLDLALEHDAIVVTPDYRLLPESTGADILDDVAHFWRWMRRDIVKFMASEGLPCPDIGNVLCCGESSGGFISVYNGFHLTSMLQTEEVENMEEVVIRGVISISAPLDATPSEFKVPRPRVFMGRRPPPPRQALAQIRDYIKNIPKGAIRTNCEPTPEMWELFTCIAQQAMLHRLFGKEALDGLIQSLDDRSGDGKKMCCPVWIVHGQDDTMIPAACSSGFARRLQETQTSVPVRLTVPPGEHLFDVNLGIDTDWIQEGVQFLGKFWPRSD